MMVRRACGMLASGTFYEFYVHNPGGCCYLYFKDEAPESQLKWLPQVTQEASPPQKDRHWACRQWEHGGALDGTHLHSASASALAVV